MKAFFENNLIHVEYILKHFKKLFLITILNRIKLKIANVYSFLFLKGSLKVFITQFFNKV